MNQRLIVRRDAISRLGERGVDSKLGRHWQVLLPGVYATDRRSIDERDRCRAALLYAGVDSVLSDACALRLYGLRFVPDDDFVRVLVPNSRQRTSRQFVVVRRVTRMPEPVMVGDLRLAPMPRALCDLALRSADERSTLAVAADAVQRKLVTVSELMTEAERASARGKPRVRRMVEALASGIRSAPERDFRLLVRTSRTLPEPLWNARIRLPDGSEWVPDALFEDAGLVHETNGRAFHAAYDQFEDMQRRNDAFVAAGLTVLHNSPRRIATEPDAVRVEVESCYRRLSGRGLPPGVAILHSSPR